MRCRPYRGGSSTGCRLFFHLLTVWIWCWVLAAAPRPPPQMERRPEWIRAGPLGALTSARRQVLVKEFEDFVETQTDEIELAAICEKDHPLLSTLAREFGFSLYEQRRPQADLRDLLLGIQDAHGYARPAHVAPWRVVRTWGRLEPSEIRTPMPYSIFKAVRAVALGWKWFRVAVILHIAYFGLLRPAEAFVLKRCDIMLHTTTQGLEWLIRLERVKSWSRGAKNQYTKVDASQCCSFSDHFVQKFSPSAK